MMQKHARFPPLNANNTSLVHATFSSFRPEIYSSSEKTSSPFLRRAMRSFFFFRSSAEESLAFFSTLSILFLETQ